MSKKMEGLKSDMCYMSTTCREMIEIDLKWADEMIFGDRDKASILQALNSLALNAKNLELWAVSMIETTEEL